MTAPGGHEVFAELAAGHALDALEPADQQVFLEHLETCAECQQSVAWHTETLGHLAYAAEPAELPPGILEGIRRGIADTARPPVEVAEPAPVQLAEVRAR